jgi:hypothetical protein
MLKAKNILLFGVSVFSLLTLSGCTGVSGVDSFGEEKSRKKEHSLSSDQGLKLLNTHEQEFSSEYKSEFSNEPN